jgi:hypothetical protein
MAKVATSEQGAELAKKRWGNRKEDHEKAQTRRITALADRAEIEAAALRKELVERQPIIDMVRSLAQAERDAILSWPARAAPMLAAELGIAEPVLFAALDASLRAHLTERAEITMEV